jgi:hypothetical protein
MPNINHVVRDYQKTRKPNIKNIPYIRKFLEFLFNFVILYVFYLSNSG